MWLDRLEAEIDNLRAAQEWCLASEDHRETGLLLCSALWLFWDMRGYQREGRARAEAAASAWGEVAQSAARAKALATAGILAMIQADYSAGHRLFAESLAISRQIGAEAVLCWSLNWYAQGAIQELANPTWAATLAEEALALARRRGDTWNVSTALFGLGLLAWHRGDDGGARALFEECLALNRGGLHSAHSIPFLLHNLGALAWRRGDYRQGLALEREALELRRDTGDKRGMALSLEGLAWLASAQHQPARAARLFGAAEALREAMGAPLPPFRQGDHDRCVAAARAQISATAFDAAWSCGRARPLEEMIAEALTVDERLVMADCLLSPREIEVAGLIAQGLTNQEIADRLIIGRRTAETHAAHILGKLGFSTRPQIAAWFVEHGPPAAERS
jgi:non-specific serine/threonine protein kinase